jgi:hypothetical protein
MATNKEKLNALIAVALENGKTIQSCGDYDGDAEEGHEAKLIQHGGLYLVVEHNNDDENVALYTDATEARENFDEIKDDIQDEE